MLFLFQHSDSVYLDCASLIFLILIFIYYFNQAFSLYSDALMLLLPVPLPRFCCFPHDIVNFLFLISRSHSLVVFFSHSYIECLHLCLHWFTSLEGFYFSVQISSVFDRKLCVFFFFAFFTFHSSYFNIIITTNIAPLIKCIFRRMELWVHICSSDRFGFFVREKNHRHRENESHVILQRHQRCVRFQNDIWERKNAARHTRYITTDKNNNNKNCTKTKRRQPSR